MRTIFKYPLLDVDVQGVTMPKGAMILSVQIQNETLCLWAEVETTKNTELRTIEIIGTGNQISMVDNREFIATVQTGAFVWHVFERTTSNGHKK